jgi:penicillin-binding protein 1C
MRFFDKWTIKKKIFFAIILVLTFWYYFSIPDKLFKEPYSTAVFSSDSILIGARIAKDGQWRFENHFKVPEKYIKSLIIFEDKRFYYHPGFDIISFLRAVKQNISSGRFVSGASTITMQVIRLSKKNPQRTVWNKIKEIILATRLEMKYSKEEILNLYAAHAPYGGNVVGLEAASWRYFGLPPGHLTWAQSATLAVLPNSPGLIHPGANRSLLKKKRDRLLLKLKNKNIIDAATYRLSLLEDLPDKPLALPSLAQHLTDRLSEEYGNGRFYTNIDKDLQEQVIKTVEYHQRILRGNEIYNIAVIIVRNSDGAVLSYVGNTDEAGNLHNNYVDMIKAGRSGGSILKPLLYASAFEQGTITPYQLLPDIPVNINGYNPENYNRKYSGSVTAEEALSRSLNVPAVILLKRFGITNMINRFHDFGLTTVTESAEYYGLPLILGAPDVKLWELAGVYSSMARTLNNYVVNNSMYSDDDFHQAVMLKSGKKRKINFNKPDAPVLSASAIWNTFNIMTKVIRPDDEGNWEEFYSHRKIAWKTGTSFGLRDAWSVGVSKNYTVGVWVGNSNGKGRPGLVGVKAAAPVLFDVFDKLPNSTWFETPHDDLKEVSICHKSGFIASENCEEIDTVLLPLTARYKSICPFHKVFVTDITGEYLVPEKCRQAIPSKLIKRFILPPLQEYYYKMHHPEYKGIPLKEINCENNRKKFVHMMEFIYPNDKTKMIIPRDFDGKMGRVVFKIAHRIPKTKVFWHIDNRFIAKTVEFHNIEVLVKPGKHILTVIDENGDEISRSFEVVK